MWGKRFLISTAILLAFSTSSWAIVFDPYVGVGINYSVEQFHTGADFIQAENAFGFDLRAGMRFVNKLTLELLFQYTPSFALTSPILIDSDVSFLQAIARAKYFFGLGPIDPYMLSGIGIGKAMGTVTSSATGTSTTSDDSGLVTQIGAGVEVQLPKNFSIFGEVSYIVTFDPVDDLNHIPLVFGANYWF